MSTHRERELAARQMSAIRRLQLQRAQAEESAARAAAARCRLAHEQALGHEAQCRAGHLRALNGEVCVDLAILRQWMQASAEAEKQTKSLQLRREEADAAVQTAWAKTCASEKLLAEAAASLREAHRTLQRKVDEKKLDTIEQLMRVRTL